MHRNLTWAELLEKLSQKAFDCAEEDELELLESEQPGRLKSRWLGFPCAVADAIAARETALGTRLPADYRAFLSISNGFRGLAELPYGLCSLLAVEEIGWIGDKDGDGGGGRLDTHDWDDAAPEDFMAREDRKRALLIGDSDGNECILLLPPREADDDWEAWTYHPEAGFLGGDTFRAFLESALEV